MERRELEAELCYRPVQAAQSGGESDIVISEYSDAEDSVGESHEDGHGLGMGAQ